MALQHLRSSTANKRPLPAGMSDGQLAINTNSASPGLFFKDSTGALVKAGPVHVGTTAPNVSPASGGATGNSTGELWLDTSVTPNQLKTWNGSAWVSDFPDEIPVAKLADGAARQLLQTDAAGTGVEWTSNVDVPGTLDVTSTATFDSIASHPLGSAGAPTITFTGDTNTGLYSPGADQVAISTNGTGRLFVDASGNVGVGITPTTRFNIYQAGSTQAALVETNQSASVINFKSTGQSSGQPQVGCAASDMILNTNGSERLRITSAGLVGVGTSSPSQLFHVSGGQARVSTGAKANSNNYLVLGTTDSTNPMELIFSNITNSYWSIQSVEQQISLRPLVLNPSGGNVGVGTTSPAYALDVASVVAQVGDLTDAFIQYKSTAGNWHVGANSSNAYVFYSGTYGSGSERARIDSSGRLLVGTTTSIDSDAKLQVRDGYLNLYHDSSATNAGYGINFSTNGGATGRTHGRIQLLQTTGNGGTLVFSTTADGASSPTERVRINSSGDVLIDGSALPAAASGAYVALRGGDATCITTRRAGTASRAHVAFFNDNGQVGSITTSSSATAYNTSSDYRLKENIEPIADAAARVLQLNPCRFNFIADPDRVVDGFIAHEAQAVVPEAITGEKDAVDEDGNPIYQGIDQSKLVPLLTAALQDALGRISDLEARIAAAGI